MRWWCTALVSSSGRVSVGQHDDPGTRRDGGGHLAADAVERVAQGLSPAVDRVQAVDRDSREARQVAVLVDVRQLRELVVVDDRERQDDLAAGGRRRREQVLLRADAAGQRRDELLPDRVERRVGDLREQLAEVIEQQPRPLAQHGDGGVGAHGSEGLAAGLRHRRQQDAQLFLGVAEGLLPAQDGLVRVHDVLALGQVLQLQQAAVQPLAVRLLRREPRLELLVVDDAPLLGVDEEHLPGLQPALADNLVRRDLEDADLGGQHDPAVGGLPPAARAQPVAVEDRADDGAVGERDAGRAVPGLHHRGVEGVEVALRLVHVRRVLPRLRDHHEDGVRQ
jgi:hypothetical protein